MTNYRKLFSTRGAQTPQNAPIPGRRGMVQNDAGGYVFRVSAWERLERFLILGADTPTYYASQRELVVDNAESVIDALDTNGKRVVETVVEVSVAGRAPKNDPALFVLAMAAGLGDPSTQRAALDALPTVARTGSHLLTFVEYVNGFRGWGPALRKGIARWYTDKDAADIAYQAMKYKQRMGWSQRDVLRKAHPEPPTPEHNEVFRWIAQGWDGVGDEPHPNPALVQLWAAERLRYTDSEREAARLIVDYRLPREVVPSELLNSPLIWDALLTHMPMTAMIRNLGKMSSVGLLEPLSAAARLVVDRLRDQSSLRRARVHPIQVLSAFNVYGRGAGARGSLTWQPVGTVVAALGDAFGMAFQNVVPSQKPTLLGLDVSGSMYGTSVLGIPGLDAATVAAAMALITVATEPNVEVLAFSHRLVPLRIHGRTSVDGVLDAMRQISFGGTDCALPMIWAKENKVGVDTFAIYTDNQTWYGSVHPAQALTSYREESGRAAKLVVAGVTADEFSIADPRDTGMLDVVGFDTAAPALIADFARQEMGQ